jgi:hypothetical protein
MKGGFLDASITFFILNKCPVQARPLCSNLESEEDPLLEFDVALTPPKQITHQKLSVSTLVMHLKRKLTKAPLVATEV